MSFENTIIKENSPKWWTLLILKSRIKKCYKRSKHTWVFLFSLTGADCCCVGALKNILTVVKWRGYVVSQYLILRRKAEKCGAEETLSDLQVLPSEYFMYECTVRSPICSKNVQICAKINPIPSNPEIRAQFAGCFGRHFWVLHAYQQKAQPALLSLWTLNSVSRADFLSIKFSLNFKIHMQVCGVSKEKYFFWQDSASGLCAPG